MDGYDSVDTHTEIDNCTLGDWKKIVDYLLAYEMSLVGSGGSRGGALTVKGCQRNGSVAGYNKTTGSIYLVRLCSAE